MRILIALSRFPYPLDKGDKLRAFFQIRDLSKNNELYVVCLSDENHTVEQINEVKKYCKELIIIPQGKGTNMVNLLRGVFNSLPFQTNYFASGKMKQVIGDLVKKEGIDVCYVQLIRLINNIPFGLQTGYYLDYMDAMSKGMKNRYSLSKWYEKPFVKAEHNRLVNFEASVYSLFDGSSIISEADAETFTKNLGGRIDIIPNGVNEDFFSININNVEEKEYDIIFTGNMSYHPNVQACKYLVKQLLPELIKQGMDPKICLAGVNPSSEVLALKGKNVIVTGYVKDIKTYLLKSKVFVAPLFSGSGLQNKLLEAMAVGLPVITTSLANNALKANVNEEILVADDLTTFVNKVTYIMKNEVSASEIGLRGRNYIDKNYNWESCNLLLENVLAKTVKGMPVVKN